MDYQKIERNDRIRRIAVKAVTYVFLGVWALIVLFPFYWMVLTSFKGYGAYNAETLPQFITLSVFALLVLVALCFVSDPKGSWNTVKSITKKQA